MNLLIDINKALTLINLHEADSYYIQLRSPVNDEQGWHCALVWSHHDGDVPLESTEGALLESVLTEMLAIVGILGSNTFGPAHFEDVP